ncbi:MAG TPA: exodeoxyribonuclease VII large subunit [Candidatus Saccharimonadales bacterium]|nr:exodeoxyribonuclease VII large subunit [Candidatus Saccharimonadales bacterium]
MNMNDVELAPSEFVALLNQTLEFAYPSVIVHGELANFRVSKNRWVYFDLKDEQATVRFFGTVYQLPGPLEDGMLIKVRGVPRLHPVYGFSVNVFSITPAGEGSIKKAANLLEAKLTREGLFDPARKRPLPHPPAHIGLITSAESAAYRDFVKVLAARWGGVQISLIDVQVQGEAGPEQVAQAVAQFNQLAEAPEVLVVTRGGGSAEDLQAFSTEQVTRAVAGSRIPTLVAVGHEVDVSLAELAADQRASTPSNAAELLVPNRKEVLDRLVHQEARLAQCVRMVLQAENQRLAHANVRLSDAMQRAVRHATMQFGSQKQLLEALSPQAALRRGYAIVRKERETVRYAKQVSIGDELEVSLVDTDLQVTVQKIRAKELYGKK